MSSQAHLSKETVIVDVRDILVNLDKSVTKKFEELGIYYNYHWADESEGKYKSWQQVKNFIIMIV